MKTQKMKITILAVALLMFIGSDIFAQRGMGNGNGRGQGQGLGQGYGDREYCMNIPDLTDDQLQKIETLRVAHLKVMNNFRNQKEELRAKKHTLMASDNTDMNAINSVIDQMTSLQNKMMKESAKHQQEIRNLLTDTQKVYFDSRPMRGEGRGHKHGLGMGNERGVGYGPNCPYNQPAEQ
ncbi:MAG: hypothetical protein A2X13_09480 [Bacteroidetes bacterium GWC2_33_15]|nr:MAG: hypothetical protein A2X10_10895 [Bacteroidetes bacterium GWA2_33_15]OFX48934.1 MAG: hypothetical protein A2X13_09480 [Bacteroidetes bacterium GWC2_33_15]OFX64802.1 MAG: hypothetical protein A2X15_05735 [Bacteroidetes bacterium GWB2_32_14]OFX68504.1 MAG: hypothetical protein A2X14_15290 [Bacteroidetes bacterium GWD2_33_33]HAN19232.1 hypothetical protein [Bacteroidales bacterium]